MAEWRAAELHSREAIWLASASQPDRESLQLRRQGEMSLALLAGDAPSATP